MPRRADAGGYELSIDDDFDSMKNYRVKLYEIEERDSQFKDNKSGKAIVWKMTIHRDDGTAFEDPRTGELFELWAWTSDYTTSAAKARGYIEAFMGREMTDDEVNDLIDSGFEDGLVNKTAMGSFEIVHNADGNERLKLVLLRPIRKRGRPPGRTAETEPEPEPVAAAPAPARARQARIDDDDDA
jgi:hypothetical protein